MQSLIAPHTLPSENTKESQISQNYSQVYILMGKALYSRNTEKTAFPENKGLSCQLKVFKGFSEKNKGLKVSPSK